MNSLKFKKMFFCGIFLLSMLVLSSCDSPIGKDDTYFKLGEVSFEYHEETNITTMACYVSIENDTIYNIEKFAVELNLYCDGALVENKTYKYDYRIKRGENDVVGISFSAEGEIDQVGVVAWNPEYESVWKTYINEIIQDIFL